MILLWLQKWGETPETEGPVSDVNTERVHLPEGHGLSRESLWDQTRRHVITWEMGVYLS